MTEPVNIDFDHNPAQFEITDDGEATPVPEGSTSGTGMTEDEAHDFLSQPIESAGGTERNRA